MLLLGNEDSAHSEGHVSSVVSTEARFALYTELKKTLAFPSFSKQVTSLLLVELAPLYPPYEGEGTLP